MTTIPTHQQGMPHLSQRHIDAIRRLSAAGLGHRRIAKQLGLPATTVARARYHLGLLKDDPPPAAPAEPEGELDAARALYRREKRRAERRRAKVVEQAKAEFRTLLEGERESRKGGRPRKPGGGKNIVVGRPRPNRFVNVERDAADALVNSLGYYAGGGA